MNIREKAEKFWRQGRYNQTMEGVIEFAEEVRDETIDECADSALAPVIKERVRSLKLSSILNMLKGMPLRDLKEVKERAQFLEDERLDDLPWDVLATNNKRDAAISRLHLKHDLTVDHATLVVDAWMKRTP